MSLWEVVEGLRLALSLLKTTLGFDALLLVVVVALIWGLRCAKLSASLQALALDFILHRKFEQFVHLLVELALS